MVRAFRQREQTEIIIFRHTWCRVFLCVAIVLCPIGLAAAESTRTAVVVRQESQVEIGGGERKVGPATIFLPFLMHSAVISTHLSFLEGASFESFQAIDLARSVLEGKTRTYRARRTGAYQQLRLGVRITDWLGLELCGRGELNVGTNKSTALNNGLIGDYGADGILKLKVFERRRPGWGVLMGVGLSGLYMRGSRVSPSLALDQIVTHLENAPADVSDRYAVQSWAEDLGSARYLYSETATYKVGPSAMVALGLGRMFSLQLSVDFGYYLRTEKSVYADASLSAYSSRFGISPTVDFSPYFPIALSFEYAFDQRWFARWREGGGSEPGTGLHNLSGNIYFSKLTDLQLGLGVHLETDGPKASGNFQLVGSLSFRYFF